jgi:hypothetical protein
MRSLRHRCFPSRANPTFPINYMAVGMTAVKNGLDKIEGSTINSSVIIGSQVETLIAWTGHWVWHARHFIQSFANRSDLSGDR